jgi:hypothetical protein
MSASDGTSVWGDSPPAVPAIDKQPDAAVISATTADRSTRPAMRASPAGSAVALAGAVALVVAVFLPFWDNTTSFAQIAQNTLIQHGGWPFVALGIGAALTAMGSATTGKPARLTYLLLGGIAVGLVIHTATDKSLRMLYPIVNGTPDPTQPGTLAGIGVAVYVAAIGAGLIVLASLFAPTLATGATGAATIAAPPDAPPTAEPTKRCPDCAEIVLEDARVCKHCGYRFGPAISPPTG